MIRWLSGRNIRTRLTLWYLLILTAVVLAFSTAIYLLLERSLSTGLEEALNERTESLTALIDTSDGTPALPDAVIEAADFEEFDESETSSNPVEAQDEEPFARTYDLDGTLVSNAGAHPGLPQPESLIASALDGEGTRMTIGEGEDSFRVLVRPIVMSGEVIGVIEVGQPREDLVETMDALTRALLFVVPITLVVASAGGWFMARRALRPVDQMTRAAREITAEDLSRRPELNLPDDELGRLARTLDEMIDRIDIAFRQQRQFTADASHELRTPLTALKGRIEVTLDHSRTPEEYREALSRMDGEVDRLIRLVQRLLVLARADAGQIPIEREPVAVSQVIEAASGQMAPQASRKDVRLITTPGPDVTIWVDESLVLQLLMNVLDNSIRHTPPRGSVTFSWRSVDGFVEIDITDTGEGISPEHLEHLFERFYRADTTRGRREGHAGLGLAISRWIAEAHRGSIEASSESGAGARFSIRLPRYSPDSPVPREF